MLRVLFENRAGDPDDMDSLTAFTNLIRVESVSDRQLVWLRLLALSTLLSADSHVNNVSHDPVSPFSFNHAWNSLNFRNFVLSLNILASRGEPLSGTTTLSPVS